MTRASDVRRMVTLLETVLTVVTVLVAIGGLAGVVALSTNYEGVMNRTDKLTVAVAAVLIALTTYTALF